MRLYKQTRMGARMKEKGKGQFSLSLMSLQLQLKTLLEDSGGDAVIDGKCFRPRVYHIQVLEPQVLTCNAHRLRQLRRFRTFELEANSTLSLHGQKIELCAGLRPPEVDIPCSQAKENLFQSKPLP